MDDRELLTLKSTLGGYVRRGNDEAAEQARRALALAKTELRIRQAIEAAPPLDADTLARLRALIPPAPSEDRGAEK